MEPNREELTKNLLCAAKELPGEAREGLLWILKNFSVVLELCKNFDMTEEDLGQQKKYAVERKDYHLLALLCAAESYQKMLREGEIPENTKE